MFNFNGTAKLKIGNSKLETRKSKIEIGNSKLETRHLGLGIRNSEFENSKTCIKFRFSIFDFRVSNFEFPLSNFEFPATSFGRISAAFLLVAALFLPGFILGAQVETVASAPTAAVWVSHGKMDGHLALKFSSAGAFSPDGSLLAVVSDEKLVLMNLRTDGIQKILKPRLPDITDIQIHSASFLSPHQLFMLANGVFHAKGKGKSPTPLLSFEWNTEEDRLEGKVSVVGVKGGYSPARFFPTINYLAIYKDSNFDLWNPLTGQGGRVTIPDLTQIPNLYEISPDGHWLLLGQIQTTSGADPSVVELKTHKFVDQLHGHEGTVMSMAFSRDTKRVVTACEDGKLRIYSVGDWKLLQTLAGHIGTVHRAEFSPNGKWIASAGEDRTVRVWSAEDGTLLQTLEESREPLLDVTFSPDSRFLAASSENEVLTWKRQGGD